MPNKLDAKERSEIPFRTANETIIRAMENFSISEPKSILIIYTCEDGGVEINANVGKCMALGMMETVKNMIFKGDV